MRELVWICAVFGGLAGCGAAPYCGVDDVGEDVASCFYDAEAVTLEFCPGDHWGAVDGCESCACLADGVIDCTSICAGTATGAETTTPTGGN